MKNKFTQRPTILSKASDLHQFYWLKTELIDFCQKHELATLGSKKELIKRIEVFIAKGIKTKTLYLPKKSTKKDSLSPITKETLVNNYNNDAKTRSFFVSQLGKGFKFNAYLRQFTNPDNIKSNMTYGDLINGWLAFEDAKENNEIDYTIPPQFEYNRFIKDFFANEKNGTLKQAISAWKFIKSKNGPNTYSQYRLLVKNKL